MSCAVCQDKGLVTVNWLESDSDYALCLCSTGNLLRATQNANRHTGFALWEVWAAREGVDPSRIVRLEDVLTAEDLQAIGFGPRAAVTSLEAVVAAAKGKRGKL